MKHFKTFLSLALCGIMLVAFSACGKEDAEKKSRDSKPKNSSVETADDNKPSEIKKATSSTKVYNGIDLSKYVTFQTYKGMKIKDGVVENGDVANIDYCGKKDGVAFEGGTAEGYDLTIGSHSFIDGFEEGLVGVKVGATVDLNLKFPDQYQSEELAGKAVVFTVAVNSIKKPLTDRLVDLATIKDIPENKNATECSLVLAFDAYYRAYQGASLDIVMQYSGMNINDLMEQMTSQGGDAATILEELKADPNVQKALDRMTVCYALFQKEDLKYDSAKLDGLTGYSCVYEEYKQVEEAVYDFLVKNAVKE